MKDRDQQAGQGAVQTAAAFQQEFKVSRETIERLEIYHDLLLKWQKAQNLVAPNTLSDVWSRHFTDSAQIYSLLPFKAKTPLTVIDMGAGAGFPGLVLAILAAETTPNPLNMHLIEANGRKCAFLRDVARQTGVHVDIHNCRIETFAIESTIPPIDVVTARALKPLSILLSLGEFAFSNEAVGLFLKGQSLDDELADAEKAWSFEALVSKSMTDPSGRIVSLSKIKQRS